LRLAGHRRHRSRRDFRLLYAFDLRENVLDLQEAAGGARMHPNYMRVGGVNGDLPSGFLPSSTICWRSCRAAMRELRGLLQANPILQDRTIDVGILSAEEALQWSLTGPALRASGVAYDVRKAFPYSGYDRYEFDVPTRTEGDAYARFWSGSTNRPVASHPQAGSQGSRYARSGHDRRHEGGGSAEGDDRASMEALIHHFKIVSEGSAFRRETCISPSRARAASWVTTSSATAETARSACARDRRRSTISKRSRDRTGQPYCGLVVMIGSLDPVFGEVDR